MENQSELLKKQYELVKGSREVLFRFCESFSPNDYLKEVSGFGRGSVRNLLVHISNTYIFWIKDFAMKQQQSFLPNENYKDVESARKYFESPDQTVNEFLNKFGDNLNEIFSGTVTKTGRHVSASVFKLFTHLITHEFHHKGQILSIGRSLGYIPPDTDVIRLP